MSIKIKIPNKNYPINKNDGSRYAPRSKEKFQDPMWYAENSQAVKDMASFPWNEVVGSSVISDPAVRQITDAVPGAMIVSWIPAFASYDTGEISNSITRSANMFYNYYSQAFTATLPQQAPDVFMACLAAADIFNAMRDIKRVIGQMHYFLQLNSYHGRHIIEAMGYDYDDWDSNLANARSEFNIRAAQLSKTVACPKNLAVAQRWAFLNENIFTDTTSPDYSTSIIYVQRAYLKYNATGAKTGTCLTYRYKPSTHKNGTKVYSKLTVAEAFAIVDDLLNALNDDDVRSVFGALRRVYGENEFMTCEPIDKAYITPVSRNDVVAASLHNATWFPDLSTSPTNYSHGMCVGWMPGDISTSGNSRNDVALYQTADQEIISQVGYVVRNTNNQTQIDGNDMFLYLNTLMNQGATILDIYDHLVSSENVLDITVNKAVPTSSRSWPMVNNHTFFRIACRCELLTDIQFLTFTGTDGINPILDRVGAYSISDSNGGVPSTWRTDGSVNTAELMLLSHVDSHPLIPIVKYDSSLSTRYAMHGYFGELDRYTLLSNQSIETLHKRTLWKLLQMPANSKSTT